MSVQEAMDRRFKELAVQLMHGIGVTGVTTGNLMSNPAYRAQFRAMLLDAKLRFDPSTENYAAICRLIAECDAYPPEPVARGEPQDVGGGLRLGVGGSGYQVPRLEDPGPLPMSSHGIEVGGVRHTEFCPACGAGIGKFRRHGEGTCPECEHLGDTNG